MFVDGHEHDVVEDCIHFLKKMEELKSYMVEFNKKGTIKSKVYPSNCAVQGKNRRPIILITQFFHKQWCAKSMDLRRKHIFTT